MIVSPTAARVINKFKLLRSVNITSVISVNGKKVRIPLIKKLGYGNLNLSEPWMTDLLVKLKPVFNGCFVDVGVNIGQTLIKAQSVFDDPRYIGFEPNTSCVHYLQELIAVNNYRNTEIIPVGISNNPEILKLNFFYTDETDPSASIIENFRPDEKVDHFKYVPVFDSRTVEIFLPVDAHPILKIDVEGAELEVIRGLSGWMQKTRPVVIIEILPVYSANRSFRLERQNELEAIFQSMNYKLTRVKKNAGIKIEELESIGIHSSIEDSDYLLFPAEMQSRISNCFK